MIAKKATGDYRPLTIMSSTDKIVAQAINIVLTQIYEGTSGIDTLLNDDRLFKSCSHGFRPRRGCHTALNTIMT